MTEYIEEAIADGTTLDGVANTPATRDLFEINETCPLLTKAKHDGFHSIVAKLLFVSKRSRLDIQLAQAFLCTRVSNSTEQDWEKLRRLLKYLKRTINLHRIIGADDFSVMKTWVDASYATHADMRSHTGGAMSFGTGMVTVKSAKQKLNTKSSTEAEIVGASDYIPWTIWCSRFLKHQGYSVRSNIFFKIIRVLFDSRRTAAVLQVTNQGTLISDIFYCRCYQFAQLQKWSTISLLNHYKGLFTRKCEISSWA